jgi:peroxiredoxin
MHFRSGSRDRLTNHVKWEVMTAGLISLRSRPIVRRLALAAAMITASVLGAVHAAPLALLGQSAPDFVLAAFRGDNVRLSESLGQPVIIAFWGTSCGTCKTQLERLDRLYQTYSSAGLVVLAISVDDDMQRAERYAHAHPMHYPVLLDPDKSVSRAYQIDRLPTTVLIDRGGTIRFLHDELRSTDAAYVTQIRTLLDDQDSLQSASALTH